VLFIITDTVRLRPSIREGTDPIVMTDVECTGRERNCSHNQFSDSYHHNEDV